MTLAAKMLALSPERRALVFEQAAAGQAGQSVMLEKDFWVSWLLGLLFADPELGPNLVFKGGTSLSKVFNIIDRFSEDIDLCTRSFTARMSSQRRCAMPATTPT